MQGSRALFGHHFLTCGTERSRAPYGAYRIAQSGMRVRHGHDGPFPSQKTAAISVGGAHNSPTGDPNGPDGEVMLDIEVAGAVAPAAQIAAIKRA